MVHTALAIGRDDVCLR